jgi:NTP pyrophosphatase (non-canonical NTP hydrolase)
LENSTPVDDEKMTTISESQELMKRTYLQRDKKKGTYATLLRMTSEVGEMLDAVLRNDLPQIHAEAADVLAWLCSACNLLSVDLEKAFLNKYENGCPRCCQVPCACKGP